MKIYIHQLQSHLFFVSAFCGSSGFGADTGFVRYLMGCACYWLILFCDERACMILLSI